MLSRQLKIDANVDVITEQLKKVQRKLEEIRAVEDVYSSNYVYTDVLEKKNKKYLKHVDEHIYSVIGMINDLDDLKSISSGHVRYPDNSMPRRTFDANAEDYIINTETSSNLKNMITQQQEYLESSVFELQECVTEYEKIIDGEKGLTIDAIRIVLENMRSMLKYVEIQCSEDRQILEYIKNNINWLDGFFSGEDIHIHPEGFIRLSNNHYDISQKIREIKNLLYEDMTLHIIPSPLEEGSNLQTTYSLGNLYSSGHIDLLGITIYSLSAIGTGVYSLNTIRDITDHIDKIDTDTLDDYQRQVEELYHNSEALKVDHYERWIDEITSAMDDLKMPNRKDSNGNIIPATAEDLKEITKDIKINGEIRMMKLDVDYVPKITMEEMQQLNEEQLKNLMLIYSKRYASIFNKLEKLANDKEFCEIDGNTKMTDIEKEELEKLLEDVAKNAIIDPVFGQMFAGYTSLLTLSENENFSSFMAALSSLSLNASYSKQLSNFEEWSENNPGSKVVTDIDITMITKQDPTKKIDSNFFKIDFNGRFTTQNLVGSLNLEETLDIGQQQFYAGTDASEMTSEIIEDLQNKKFSEKKYEALTNIALGLLGLLAAPEIGAALGMYSLVDSIASLNESGYQFKSIGISLIDSKGHLSYNDNYDAIHGLIIINNQGYEISGELLYSKKTYDLINALKWLADPKTYQQQLIDLAHQNGNDSFGEIGDISEKYGNNGINDSIDMLLENLKDEHGNVDYSKLKSLADKLEDGSITLSDLNDLDNDRLLTLINSDLLTMQE